MAKEASIPSRPDPPDAPLPNDVVARRLDEVARLLEAQDADPFRVRRWGAGGSRVRQLASLHRELGIATLEDLEAAAHSGRLASVEGFGSKRVAGILDALASRLGRARFPRRAPKQVPVAEIVEVDAEFRRKAAAGALPRIAPRRFNPTHEAWLPVLHAERGGRHWTALFSNTSRAHELGRTGEWVVIFHEGPGDEQRETVVTVHGGSLSGKRVVRGREAECAKFYLDGSILHPAGSENPEAPAPPEAPWWEKASIAVDRKETS